MSLALIEESAKEVRRLAIAGSSLAVGDFRLKKLVAPLEQAGTKVPVFAQVAKSINDLVAGTEADSPNQLLNLSTLLNAVLYTQGESGATGDYRDLEVFATNCCSTKTTSRVLKPLVEALTSSGGGRLEVIKTACERGTFNDLRLIDPAIQALGDNFPELADLVAEKVLPAYGPGIVSRLKATFDLKGKKQDARKLTVMHQADPSGTLELCKTALDDGSAEVKAAAITCLGAHEECLSLVLEQASAKNKLLRAAALEALAQHDHPEVTKLFTGFIKGKALDLLARPFRALRNRQVLSSLFGEGRRVFAEIIKGDSGEIPRFWQILDCLEQRKDAETEDFLLGCLASCDKLAKVKAAKNSPTGGMDVVARLAVLLDQIGSPKGREALLAKREILPPEAFPQALRSALYTWPADKVFAEFAPLLQQKKGAGQQKSEELQRFICAAHWDETSRFAPDYDLAHTGEAQGKIDWDPRWLDAAIKSDRLNLVCALARPNHKATLDYLLKLDDSKRASEPGLIVRALVRCQYPKVTDYFLNVVASKTKGARYLDYALRFLFEAARHLPPADLAKLDAFAATLDEKFVDHFLEAIAPLRPAPPSN